MGLESKRKESVNLELRKILELMIEGRIYEFRQNKKSTTRKEILRIKNSQRNLGTFWNQRRIHESSNQK